MGELNIGLKSIDTEKRNADRKKELKANIKDFKKADGVLAKIGQGAKVGLSGFRVATGLATTPIIIALDELGKAMPKIGRLIVQPLQIPTFLFSKAFSTKSKYNGKTITNCGESLGELIGGLSRVTSRGAALL